MSSRAGRGPAIRFHITLVLCINVIVSVGSQLAAQSIPTGWQEYYVIGREQHVWDMMYRVAVGEGATAFDNSASFINGMNSVVTATAAADNQVIFYDHWEDGFEADIRNPAQATTMIIGDGNTGNGQACDFTGDPRIAPCDGSNDDTLFQGSYVNFNSDQGLPGITPNPDPGGICQAGLPAPPLDRRCSVPVNPRLATDIRFDGGDRLVSSGGPLSVAHPQDPLSPYIGGATENISRQAVQAARSYSIPIGEDIYGGNGSVTEPLKYVDLNLVAFSDGTQVFINSPGAGSVSFILDQGQHYTTQGLIDDSTPAPAITVNAGTKVSTSAAIAGLIFAGGDGTFSTRMFTLLPDLLHSTDYVLTAPGDDPALQGSRPLNIYIFNPDPLNAADVTVTDSLGSVLINVPSNAMVDYFTGTGRFVPTTSTVRLTSDRNFWGVSAYDHASPANDWGHSWLARRFLTETYTVLFAPGVNNAAVESQPAQRLANDPDCTIPPAVPGICDTLNRSPVFVAATQNSTEVQVDFDNDGTFDVIDLDGDDYPDAAPRPNNTYVIDALETLRVYDHTDYDNTGSRVITNKPAALAYGEDTDQATGPDPIQDTGYVVYPISQAFLDPVLTIDKEADSTVVPIVGGTVTYTLTVRSYDFGPLTSLQVWDLLPAGITTADYVPGSTLVTYPDLSQDTTDPGFSIDPGTGRDRLDWSLSPDSLDANRTITISYSIAIPAAPGGMPRLLINEAHAQGTLGGSVFSPLDTYRLVQTDIAMTKSVDLTMAEQTDVLTYTLQVSNNGVAVETGVVITDAIPPDTTYVAGSITSAGPFVGSFDPAQNAVVWTAASFPVGGPHTLSFQARVNPGVLIGTVVENSASYESNQTPLFEVNPTQTMIVGPDLDVSKTGPAVLHPNEVATFEILIDNSGSGTGNLVLVVDPFPTNATYLAESMEWSLNSQPFVSLTDAADSDEGTAYADRIELNVASLGANEDLRFRFKVRVNAGTNGQFVNNQATVAATEVPPIDTNLVQIPIVGDADIIGHLFIDTDGDGTQDPGEPDLANVDVEVIDAMGNPQVASTDSNGDFLFTVEPGSATLDVVETDPDFPNGATLTTANEPQVVTAVTGSTVAATDIGYQLPPLAFIKTSDAIDHLVAPGQVVTYELSLTNNTSVTQTGIAITDPVPTGVSAVPGSTQVQLATNDLRVREYYLPPSGGFTGTSYSLTLDENLEPNYFVVVQGSDGNGTDSGNRGPDENYARLVADPFGTGDLLTSGASDVIELRRGNAVDAWSGVVTVVECLADCSSSGFTLVDVAAVDHSGASVSGSFTSTSWSDINQVMLMGGFNGSGCETAEPSSTYQKVCHARIYPSGTNQINWTRDGGGGVVLSTATSTVMVVEWGSEWTVQRVRVQGNNGGDGANAVGEYNTAAITAVTRDNTWVWGTGHTNDQGIGDAAEGVLVTLGDGVNQNVTENQVAVGLEYGWNAVDFEVYALTHASLAVDYRFKPDGDQANLTLDVAVDNAGGQCMALVSNGQNGNGNAYPRPMLSARYTTDANVRLERRRWGQPFPAWVQGIDFTDSVVVVAGNDPPNLVVAGDGYTLAPGATMTVTFQVQADNPLAPAVVQIANTATVVTDQEGPATASVTDDVVRPRVMVEPDDAEITLAGASVIYRHEVINTGTSNDSYDLSLGSELGYAVELVDPESGAVMATDSNGDGVWDGGMAPNTGTLSPGASASYDIRVHVPPGTPVGTQETTTLTATSDRWPNLASDAATDETIVVGPSDFGPIILLPDHSGVVNPGGSVVYAHRVINNMGVSDTLSLQATSILGWTTTIYNDSNGDGVYNPGLDVAVSSTRRLADGEWQLFFVVVDADPGATPGTVDVTHVTASGSAYSTDPTLTDAVSDTTTVTPPELMDLSGGGTRIVLGGSVPVFPGTLTNLDSAANTYELSLTPSWFFGRDAFLHPTQLVLDTDADGIPDTLLAEDSDGDGTWDMLAPGADSNGDGDPDVVVAAGATLAYELRRPVDPQQTPQRDPVTLTASSRQTGEADSVTAINLLASLTEAWIASFEAGWFADVVIVEWETAAEVGTLAFELERRVAGETRFERVHAAPLSALLHAPQGGVYRFVDHGAEAGVQYEYRLLEIDVNGRRKSFGPVVVDGDPGHGPMPSEVFTARPRAVGSYSAPPIRWSSVNRDGQRSGWVKITTRGTGIVFVDAGELAAAFGVARSDVESWIAAGLLGLGGEYSGNLASHLIFADDFESGDLTAWGRGNSGKAAIKSAEVAWLAAPNNSGLYFYAEALESIYTTDRVYWLRHAPGRPMQRVDGGTPTPTPDQTFVDHASFEEEAWPFTAGLSDPESDFWFWEFFRAENPNHAAKSLELDLPGVAAVTGTASFVIRLQGASDMEAVLDHRVQVRLNNTLVADESWSGFDAHSLELDVDQALLQEGPNQLNIAALLNPGVAADVFYLDSVGVGYQRHCQAVDDTLSVAADGHAVLTIGGFSRSEVVVFDVTDPPLPAVVTTAPAVAAGGGFQISFAPPRPQGRYLATTLDSAARPVAVRADLRSDLRSGLNRGEYLIIAAPGLETAARPLADFRTSRGLTSRVVSLEEVYDEFSNGIATPWAIRDLIAWARAEWAVPPQWVVLAGDASFDYRDVLGRGGNMLPAPMTATPSGLVPSDNLLADLSGSDGVPEVAIGRIPVTSAAELEGYVDKLIAVESAAGAWKQSLIWLADDPDAGGEFVNILEALIDLTPAGFEHSRVYLDELGINEARSRLQTELARGALVTLFAGHGGIDRLADEGLLLIDDVGGLGDVDRAPIMAALSCSVGRFDLPGLSGIGERLVVEPGGGAAALWAPSGLALTHESVVLAEEVVASLDSGLSVGEAVQRALEAYARSGNQESWLPLIFVLLGDPAMDLGAPSPAKGPGR